MSNNTAQLYNEDTGWIETFKGNKFHPLAPTFDIEDIAHGLAMNCRYNGHCRKFYSVAEHSVLVAELMGELKLGDPFEGLMHDASEAYLSDVPAPFKQYLPDLATLDHAVETSLRSHFGLPLATTLECKRCDWILLYCEAFWLLPSKGVTFHDPLNLRPRAMEFLTGYRPKCYNPEMAEKMFLSTYKYLSLTNSKAPKLTTKLATELVTELATKLPDPGATA